MDDGRSLPAGYMAGVNGSTGNATTGSDSKRAKAGLEHLLLNAAALLAGVGLGGDLRYSGVNVIQPTRTPQHRR